ncbi:CLUMA_CG002024, isoform A [Clunio marinus]|uniref:CLUMA_CG002024, isoform A n=1 Tax=Clunio marinus TaxID=568069 RepID=A0A1J1HJZ7_9DIPT|nr:CLUMA_CG002024, isoform A [Clunio marinus]
MVLKTNDSFLNCRIPTLLASAHPIKEDNHKNEYASNSVLTGFDCTDFSSDQTTVSLLNSDSCSLKTVNVTNEIVEVQVLQSQQYDKKAYVQCYVRYFVSVHHCGRWMASNTFLNSYNYILPITRAQCEDMHRHNIFVDPARRWITIHIKDNHGSYNGLAEGNVDNGGSCEGSNFIDHNGKKYPHAYALYDIKVVINKGLADVNIDEKKIILANGLNCEYTSESCFDPLQGFTHWTMGLSNEYCDRTKPLFVIYRGQVNKTTEYKDDNTTKISYFNQQDDRLFYIEAQHKTRICGYEAAISQHPNIFITEVMDYHQNFKRDHLFSIKNIDALILHGMSLSMLYNDISTQMTRLYQNIQFQKCLSDQKIIAATLSNAQSDPNSLGLSIFNTQGFITKVRGEIAYIIKCKPSEVSFRQTKNCFLDIPIYHDNKPKFLSPRSRLIIDIGTEISCDDFFQPLFNFGNEWYSRVNGKFIQAQAPQSIKVETIKKWTFEPLSGISHKGIYSKEDIENYKRSITEPIVLKAVQNSFFEKIYDREASKKHNAPIYSIANSIDDVEYEKIFKIGDWFKQILSSLYGDLLILGDIFSAILAIFCILSILKFFVDWIINGYALYQVFGFTWRIFFGFWNSVAKVFLDNMKKINNHMTQAQIEMKKEISENEIDYQLEQVPSAPQYNNYSLKLNEIK